jgi:Ca2+-binding EF-hand superfamily protein
MKNYFKMADGSKDGTLSLSEVHEFLKKINLKFTKEELKNLMRV